MAENHREITDYLAEDENEKSRAYASHMHSHLESLGDGNSTQSSHRLLAYSDALLSIIATVMVGNNACLISLTATSLLTETGYIYMLFDIRIHKNNLVR